jgi:hypothetical protein
MKDDQTYLDTSHPVEACCLSVEFFERIRFAFPVKAEQDLRLSEQVKPGRMKRVWHPNSCTHYYPGRRLLFTNSHPIKLRTNQWWGQYVKVFNW